MKCQYFGSCGGCQLQDMTPAQQQAHKTQEIRQLFPHSLPVLPSPQEFGYRNRMDFVTSPDAIGLRGKQFDDVIDIEQCPLMNQSLQKLYETVRAWARSAPRYDLHKQEGWLRYVVLRGDLQPVVIITTHTTQHESLVEELAIKVSGLIWTVHEGKEDHSIGRLHKTFGDCDVVMHVAGKEFLIAHDSFFQANTASMQLALEKMKEFVSKDDMVVDLFCGVGVIGQCLPHKSLLGVELSASAIEKARMNAKRNGVDATYIVGDASHHALREVDVLIVDPPRTGLRQAVHHILASMPKRIIYLSCNPKTQRRDIAHLRSQYKIVYQQGIDFFPQTSHQEHLIVLEAMNS